MQEKWFKNTLHLVVCIWTLLGPGLLIAEVSKVLEQIQVLNPLLQLIRIIWVVGDDVLS